MGVESNNFTDMTVSLSCAFIFLPTVSEDLHEKVWTLEMAFHTTVSVNGRHLLECSPCQKLQDYDFSWRLFLLM